jgi:F-type H+-transporting ATPase subunit delta
MESEPQHPTVFDTAQQQLGEVYARALLQLGQKSGRLEQFLEELDAVVDSLQQLPKFQAALESPRISFADKEKLLEKAYRNKVGREFLNFLKVVARKRRFDCLAAVRTSAHQLHDELSGRVRALITTADPIDTAALKKIEDKLSAALSKKIQMATAIDPKMIGGMVIRIGDTVYDGSVVSQLNQVRTKAIKRASDAIRQSLDRFTAS